MDNPNNSKIPFDPSIVADSQKSKSIEAPEAKTKGDRQQPEISNSTAGANDVDEDGFPVWDGGGYRGRPEAPVKGPKKPPKTNTEGTSTKPPKGSDKPKPTK